MFNGTYYIKVIAIDKFGNSAEITEGPFEITQGIEKEKKTNDDGGGGNLTNAPINDKDEEKGFLPGFEIKVILVSLVIALVVSYYHRRIR